MIYLLVHGAWHAGWCWQELEPLLRRQGHDVFSPDLPGHGKNAQDRFLTITLQTYVNYVLEMVASLHESVILVGHSMAGAIISQVAEAVPRKIKSLIYISAYVPQDRTSLLDTAQECGPTGINRLTKIDKPTGRLLLKRTPRLLNLFYNTSPVEKVKKFIPQLGEEPLQPFFDPVSLSEEGFGGVSKRYILCLKDKIILPEDQQRMCQGRIEDRVSIECDHSPFFSAPELLLSALSMV